MSQYLIIGYGNSLRCDDGAGYKVAEIVASWEIPDVRSLSVHQLTPELSYDLSQVETAIFVDVIAPNSEITQELQVIEIKPDNSNSWSGHHCDPRSLLKMAQNLYNQTPKAYLILIPAINFDFGEEFSDITNQGIIIALDKIKEITYGTIVRLGYKYE